MECLGPQCASMLLAWLKARSEENSEGLGGCRRRNRLPQETSGHALHDVGVSRGCVGRADARRVRRRRRTSGIRGVPSLSKPTDSCRTRARLDNSIENALFKAERYVARLDPGDRAPLEDDLESLRRQIREGRERVERMRQQAKRADLKIAQLATLTPEGFEEFVAEVFEALGYEVEHVGGTGDEGADLKVSRRGQIGVVQCKYHTRGRGRLAGTAEISRHDSPYAQPQRIFRYDAHVFTGRREIRRRASHRTHRRPPTCGTRSGSSRPRREA